MRLDARMRRLEQRSAGGSRDICRVCGYPKVRGPAVWKHMYMRFIDPGDESQRELVSAPPCRGCGVVRLITIKGRLVPPPPGLRQDVVPDLPQDMRAWGLR